MKQKGRAIKIHFKNLITNSLQYSNNAYPIWKKLCISRINNEYCSQNHGLAYGLQQACLPPTQRSVTLGNKVFVCTTSTFVTTDVVLPGGRARRPDLPGYNTEKESQIIFGYVQHAFCHHRKTVTVGTEAQINGD